MKLHGTSKSWSALLIGLTLSVSPALAQGPYIRPQTSPYNRQPVSSYLNIARGGSAAVNYYGITRFAQGYDATFQQIERQEADDQALMQQTRERASLPVTGHSSSFMNYSHYYGRNLLQPATMAPVRAPLAAPLTGPGAFQGR